jgi:hypothetical protein
MSNCSIKQEMSQLLRTILEYTNVYITIKTSVIGYMLHYVIEEFSKFVVIAL